MSRAYDGNSTTVGPGSSFTPSAGRVTLSGDSVLRHSIKARLIATVVVSQLLLATGLILVGIFYTKRGLLQAFDATLDGRAMSVAALVRYPDDNQSGLIFDKSLVPPPVDREHPDLWEVRLSDGSVFDHSSTWPAGLTLQHDGQSYWNFVWNGKPYRALLLRDVPILDREQPTPSSPPTLTLVYAATTSEMQSQVRTAGIYIAIASLFLLGVTAALAVWGIRRGLAPLQDLAARAAAVSTRNWEFQPPAEAIQTAELIPLTQAMQTMLGGLHRSFAQQREFLGNAAHELKTPVAILKSTLQSLLLQKPRTSGEYKTGLEQALEDMDRLEKLLHWMLRLSRAEQWATGALRRDLPLIDISNTCVEAIERLQALADARHVKVELSTNGPICLRADPEDLALIWVNLLENAIRHSEQGGKIDVTVKQNQHPRVLVSFEDRGSGIPASELPHVFERFHRGDPSRTRETGGFGLGLAIAKALAEAYGGTISASSTVGHGTRMTVELPVDATRP